MISINRNTRLIDATVGDLLDLIKQEQTHDEKNDFTPQPGNKYVYGLAGLAALFGCTKRSASNLKSSGKIDDAIIQDGRKIVIDADLALKLVKKNR